MVCYRVVDLTSGAIYGAKELDDCENLLSIHRLVSAYFLIVVLSVVLTCLLRMLPLF